MRIRILLKNMTTIENSVTTSKILNIIKNEINNEKSVLIKNLKNYLKDKIDNKNSLNEFYTPENDNFNIDTLNFIDTEKKLCNYLVDRFFNGIELEFPEDRMYGKYINFNIKELGFSVWVEKSPLKKSLYMKFNRDFHSELLGLIMDYLKKYLGLTALESSKYAITITYLLFKKIYEELFMTNKI